MLNSSPLMLRKALLAIGLVFLAACGPSTAQDKGFQDTLKVRKPAGGGSLADFKVELVESDAEGEVLLRIRAAVPPDHYIYSTSEINEGAETQIDIKTAEGVEPVSEKFDSDPPAKAVQDPDLERMVEKVYDRVTWTQRYRIKPGADRDSIRVAGQIKYQICNKFGCRPNNKVPFDVKLAARAAAKATNARPTQTAKAEEEEEVDEPRARPVPFNFGGSPILGGGDAKLAKFRTALRPSDKPDEMVLEISATVPADHYIYSMKKNGGVETVVAIAKSAGLEPIDAEFIADHPPHLVENAGIGALDGEQAKVLEEYRDQVKWTRRFRVASPDARQAASIEGTIFYQICGGGTCRNFKQPFSTKTDAEGTVAKASPATALDRLNPGEALPTDDSAALDAPPAGVAARDQAAEEEEDETVAVVRGIDKSQGLLWFMLRAMGFGFAALLTPCTFPMVPITVSFFHKQAEKQHHRPVWMASIYCLGIIGTFTVLGLVLSALFGAAFLNQLSNNPWLNLFIALLLVFFGLNLLGMFEIRMPSSLLTFTASQEGRGGVIGVLFMALTFTLTSFTCTFAFVGTVVVDAASGGRLWPTVGLFAFSAAFSLPFFFLALFPSYLQKLPRSGGWMNAVKVTMGLIEVGAAFKFFSVADLAWNPVAWVFDYELVMSAWMVISIATALYLLGMFRLPHDMPADHIGVARFMTAMSFLGLAAYLAVGLYGGEKPTGKVWETIAALAPPKLKTGGSEFGPTLEHGGILYALDLPRAAKYAAEHNKPLFLDFTGVNCANCRKMEAGPLSHPDITARLKKFVCVQVYADRVPVIPDPAERARLLRYNVELQTSWFGDSTLPSYAVVPPDPKIAERKNGENLLSVTIGYNPDEKQFARFLDEGFARWQKLEARRADNRAVGRR